MLSPTLDSMRGYMHVGSMKAEFFKVRKIRKVKEVTNAWSVDLHWVEDGENGYEDGHSLVALKAVDDDGNRFMQFEWYMGFMGCCPQYATYIAKRQTRSGEGLSETEKERLGIGLSASEVEERARREAEDSDSDIAGDGDDSGSKEEGTVNSDVHPEGRADKAGSRKRKAEDAGGRERNAKAKKDAPMKRNANSGRSRRRGANGK